MPEQLLKVDNLEAWYGESHILHGIDFSVKRGETILIQGGAGGVASYAVQLAKHLGAPAAQGGNLVVDRSTTVGLLQFFVHLCSPWLACECEPDSVLSGSRTAMR